MKKLIVAGAAALALAACDQGSTNQDAPVAPGNVAGATPVTPGGAGNWVEMVAATPEGGYRMGNPNARVKLVEYASLTCGVCGKFAADSAGALKERYVATGDLSFELRNLVRDPVDLTAVTLARCGGPQPFFMLSEQILQTQADWLHRLTAADQQRISALAPAQQPPAWAAATGLDGFVRMRGITADKAGQCLADGAAMERIASYNEGAQKLGIRGTPTFFINGNQVTDAVTWEALEPKLKAALGR